MTYQRPPLDVEIADLRAELARTSPQRPGHRAYLEQRIRALVIARDGAAKQHQTSVSVSLVANNGAQAGQDPRGRRLPAGDGSNPSDEAAPKQGPADTQSASASTQKATPRGDQRGLETGRTSPPTLPRPSRRGRMKGAA